MAVGKVGPKDSERKADLLKRKDLSSGLLIGSPIVVVHGWQFKLARMVNSLKDGTKRVTMDVLILHHQKGDPGRRRRRGRRREQSLSKGFHIRLRNYNATTKVAKNLKIPLKRENQRVSSCKWYTHRQTHMILRVKSPGSSFGPGGNEVRTVNSRSSDIQ